MGYNLTVCTCAFPLTLYHQMWDIIKVETYLSGKKTTFFKPPQSLYRKRFWFVPNVVESFGKYTEDWIDRRNVAIEWFSWSQFFLFIFFLSRHSMFCRFEIRCICISCQF